MPELEISEIVATTVESRRKSLADNVTNNNALLRQLKKRNRIKPFTGGTSILQPMHYAENSTYTRFSGYQPLNVQPSRVITAAEYKMKQVAEAITISGEEDLMNSGPEAVIDLLEGRIENAFSSMSNGMSTDVYSDGTADSGKQITGLKAQVAVAPAPARWEISTVPTKTGGETRSWVLSH